MTISEIQNLSHEEAMKMALETAEIKGHQVIFTDLGEFFRFSALVFKDGKHVYYANDYALHHNRIAEKGTEALKELYIEILSNKLFTDEELMEEIKTYQDYEMKRYFLINLHTQRYDYVSAFGIGEEAFKKIKESKKEYPFFNRVSYCYVNDENIIKEQEKIAVHLEKSFQELKNDMNVFREMVAKELANHEAGYTCDYEDALSALGLKFETLSEAKQSIVKEELVKLMNA